MGLGLSAGWLTAKSQLRSVRKRHVQLGCHRTKAASVAWGAPHCTSTSPLRSAHQPRSALPCACPPPPLQGQPAARPAASSITAGGGHQHHLVCHSLLAGTACQPSHGGLREQRGWGGKAVPGAGREVARFPPGSPPPGRPPGTLTASHRRLESVAGGQRPDPHCLWDQDSGAQGRQRGKGCGVLWACCGERPEGSANTAPPPRCRAFRAWQDHSSESALGETAQDGLAPCSGDGSCGQQSSVCPTGPLLSTPVSGGAQGCRSET